MTVADLRHLFITEISWHTTIDADDAAKQRVGLTSKTRRVLTKDGYEWEGDTRNHVILALTANRTKLEIEGSVHPLPHNERLNASARRRVESMPSVYELLEEMGKLPKADLHANIHWRFPPDTRKPIISLPFLRISATGLPFTEIRGVRMVHGNTSVILDLHDDNRLHVNLGFPYLDGISRNIVERIVGQATTILSGFLVPEKAEGD